VVAPRVDGIFLILRLSRQGRPHAERARAILATLGVNVLGVVVNGVTRQSGAGIYTSEQYEYAYTESYEEDDYYAGRDVDDYYAEQDETPRAGAGGDAPPGSSSPAGGPPEQQAITADDKPAPRPRSSRAGGSRGGMLGRLFTWWA
jgi:hypothetical protein